MSNSTQNSSGSISSGQNSSGQNSSGSTSGAVATAARDCGCPDFSLSRRRLLAGAAAGAGALTAGSLFEDAYRQVSYGAVPDGNVVVVLSLRGGSDGLSIVVPKDDHAYLTQKRPDLVVPLDQLVGGNGSWGLHPALAPLLPMWNAGTFGAVHGAGMPTPNRSHFDAMEIVEEANPGSNARVGWINRMVGLDSAALPEEQVQLGASMLPTALAGPAEALGAYSVNDLTVPTLWYDQSPGKALKKIWGGGAKTPLHKGFNTALGAVNRLSGVAATDMGPIEALYPDGPLRRVLANTATLIKAKVGAKMITIDYGNWDMHTGLGAAVPGDGNWMYTQLDHLATSLKAFFDDLGTDANRVTVVNISEFGRRVEQNGTGAEAGVDHGYGNAMLLLGAGVNGGDVRGAWTSVQDNLSDGDVGLSNDYRHVLWEVIKSRQGLSESQRTKVFPGLSQQAIGAMA
jgi:uncharacterized protein (DUF1501 family)